MFAAEELRSYLGKISGADFSAEPAGEGVIRLRVDEGLAAEKAEKYRIVCRGEELEIVGGCPRAVLYGAYALLERVGCRFVYPLERRRSCRGWGGWR